MLNNANYKKHRRNKSIKSPWVSHVSCGCSEKGGKFLVCNLKYLTLPLVIVSICLTLAGCSESPDSLTHQVVQDNYRAEVTKDNPQASKSDFYGQSQINHVGKDVILVMGDSLSAAYRMAKEQGWVSLLRERLTSEVDYSHYAVVNASISGATTSAGLQSLSGLLRTHQPKIVILELGANDGLQGKPIQYIRNNLSQLLSTAAAQGARTLLIGNHLPPNYGRAYTQPFFEQYADLAEQFEVAYVPFLLEGVATNRNLMMSDGLHPLPAAQDRILKNVWPKLKPMLKN